MCDVWITCCVTFVFFFKQKTAYEMRISDWSSDVCSSDLAPSGHRGRCSAETRWAGTGCAWAKAHLAWRQRSRTAAEGLSARCRHDKIGRASCRERVCQYV